MKKRVFLPQTANRIYLALFVLILGLIVIIAGRELFFPGPAIPVIDVAAERLKINQAGLKLYPGRFYRDANGEIVR